MTQHISKSNKERRGKNQVPIIKAVISYIIFK